MMAEFKWTKWTKMSLFLMLELQFRATTGQESFLTVRVGDEATLSCENRIRNQDKCDRTNWVFSQGRSPSVELISSGQIGEDGKDRSDRLSLTENCSLVIKKVTDEDVGRYTCRQFDRSGRQQGPDAVVHLSVISIYEVKNSNKTTLTCTVLTYEQCTYTVQWLNVGKKEYFRELHRSQSICSATVTLETAHLNQKSKHEESYKCNVTDSRGGKQLLYNFSSQSSSIPNGNRTTSPKHENKDPTNQPAGSGCSALNSIMLLMRVAELLLITVITVLLIRARGNQRPPDDNTVLNSVRSRAVTPSGPAASQVNDDDCTVNYENFGEPSVSVRLR
ncbi:uncharacterized protein LOC127142637 isoform X6 [Lates calcarifer]|uniref:Uncharacterized protein LOC127142637 isoform X1 n=1 Tax=Lates calcarifer TaxID=8187 RepID=A0AAJ8B9D5_LATCA|nr:uncharacterized protein LOC127142637 isoform X1 [Lates calcarifer]XP_050927648.1 uncharacterized protein LOC127142637 isoform X2 [Lates calcarifer]XP_050927650.1 uncharacterized protein LOC127142637 isoform X3 [Lates calcarifer]XP_050927651.1 uncharacterized protein LOC127142637 isoform X4 [Lates calcarifer]XP_050927652.1 uncharacterized protein LOC127142637 isoform X5 [Lates calcarifer]XP_050927653.1 uncharacterized protein LOC127142637 isoform X6 [Lates calcarifer]